MHWRRSCLLAWFSIFLSLFVVTGYAETSIKNEGSSKLLEYLLQEKNNLTITINEARQLTPPQSQAQLNQIKKENEAMLALTRAKLEYLQGFLANQTIQKEQLAQRLKKVQQSPLHKSEEMLAQERISKINTLNEVNQKIIELIVSNIELSRSYEKTLQAQKHDLEIWQAKFDERERLEQLNQRILILNKTRDDLYQKNIELQEKKHDLTFNANISHEARLLLNNQIIILIQHRITELKIRKKLIKADYLLLRNRDTKTIQFVIDSYQMAIDELSTMEHSLRKMTDLLKNEQVLLADHGLKQQFLNLQKTVHTRLLEITLQQKTLYQDLEKKQQYLKQQISLRQSLAEYNLGSWPAIFKQLLDMPSRFYNYGKVLVLKVKDNYRWQDTWPKSIFLLELCSIFCIAIGLNHLLKKVTQNKKRSRLTAHLYDGLLVLLQRNIPHLAILAALILTFVKNQVPHANYQLLVNLFLVWLTFRNLILIARLTLLERISDASGKDVRLYHRLKWIFLMGEWSTALMVFSTQLPLSSLLQDIFNRLFMLFLVAMSVVIWRSKDVFPHLLRPFLKTRKRYIRNALGVLVMLLPLTLLTIAVIGLLGYINLAWTMSQYQIYVLLVISGYVLARGLIFDALELLSEWMIFNLKNGWLWIEVILKPVDKILQVLLLLGGTAILFNLFGWHKDSWVVMSLKELGRYPLVNLSGVHITFVSIIEFLILLCVVIWAAKWTREFSYRWLYSNAKDAGIRNSLSVFTQYAVILIGGFITLRVLGLDFSGMSMILGGLAVGMGFGLRDFASNIIGGLMLLIERPVREGDLITLGEYEGRVAHIGIRSMRVSSWDNMEVLIPNAETFNKPFTNWTHQDSIVRTVVPIKVSRSDDPTIVQHLILDVLAVIPEILDDPAPQVFLKQIDDALIEFEVRYFINVQLHTRFEIRSKVLFAIMEQFKAAGIKPPIPPFSVELKKADSDIKKTIDE